MESLEPLTATHDWADRADRVKQAPPMFFTVWHRTALMGLAGRQQRRNLATGRLVLMVVRISSTSTSTSTSTSSFAAVGISGPFKLLDDGLHRAAVTTMSSVMRKRAV